MLTYHPSILKKIRKTHILTGLYFDEVICLEHNFPCLLKFIYSEKATKFCEISNVDLTVTTYDKSTVEISQNFVAFSEYMNFKQSFLFKSFEEFHVQKRYSA